MTWWCTGPIHTTLSPAMRPGRSDPHPARRLLQPQPRPHPRSGSGLLAPDGGRPGRTPADAVPGRSAFRFLRARPGGDPAVRGQSPRRPDQGPRHPRRGPLGPGAISTARWNGVKLADVLARAELRPEAAHIAFAAPDVSDLADPPQPYGGSIPVAKAIIGQVLLAWAMNDRPLPRAPAPRSAPSSRAGSALAASNGSSASPPR